MMKRKFQAVLFVLVAGAVLFAAGCASAESGKKEAPVLLQFDDIDKSGFFPTGKLSYTIEGMMVSKDMNFTNYLEGTEYTAKPNGSDVVIKGVSGELWRTPLDKVLTTYTKKDGSKLSAADFIPDQYIPMQTIAGSGNFACFVPKDKLVEIHTAWGDVLIANRPEVPHGVGDYLVCREGSDGKPDFSDVWVVNGVTFPHTYDMTYSKR
ncbi:hypothetical protein [Breznakiella homolactica]|uniref:Lipoprotein n=1 Tax=Breznakiella homolactica TaxID=2798577 RepID=A0A7T7XPV0_9SPIR|nr:hypothetical protein [Breznakiella homolactica]QQO10254.1 hypothetical protein JFL75_04865 [Breznakiella homolactica]